MQPAERERSVFVCGFVLTNTIARRSGILARVGTPEGVSYPARTYPCQRFTSALTGVGA